MEFDSKEIEDIDIIILKNIWKIVGSLFFFAIDLCILPDDAAHIQQPHTLVRILE